MTDRIVLASRSEIRSRLLRAARVAFEAVPARIDEEAITAALLADGATPRDIVDALAEQKARKVAARDPGALVIGCDQVLEFDGRLVPQPQTEAEAIAQVSMLSGQTHRLLTAVVLYRGTEHQWRHLGQVRLTMHAHPDAFIADYVARNWDSIRTSLGGYKLEEEGITLFSALEGDYFTALGLPLVPLLSYLRQRRTGSP